MAESVVRRRNEGAAYWVLGGLYEVLVAGAETDDKLTLMQFTIPAGMGPPPHTHDEAETLTVLEGTIRLHVGDQTYDLEPGASCYFPPGTLETFEPISDVVRVQTAYTPGGMDRFFAEFGEPATARVIPPTPESPPDLERLTAIGERYGLHLRLPAAH